MEQHYVMYNTLSTLYLGSLWDGGVIERDYERNLHWWTVKWSHDRNILSMNPLCLQQLHAPTCLCQTEPLATAISFTLSAITTRLVINGLQSAWYMCTLCVFVSCTMLASVSVARLYNLGLSSLLCCGFLGACVWTCARCLYYLGLLDVCAKSSQFTQRVNWPLETFLSSVIMNVWIMWLFCSCLRCEICKPLNSAVAHIKKKILEFLYLNCFFNACTRSWF